MPAVVGILEPELLPQLARLDLASPRRRRRPRAGVHPGRTSGREDEFREHRPYVVGDDRRSLDARASARTGRLLVRVRHEPARRAVRLLLDASGSMDYPIAAGSESKLDRACRLAAAIAYLALSRGDRVELLVSGRDALVPTALWKPTGRIAFQLRPAFEKIAAGGESEIGDGISRLASRLSPGELVVILSDLYGDEGRLENAIRRAASSGAELAVLEILSEAERDLPAGVTTVREIETGRRRAITDQDRSSYSKDLESWRERTRTRVRSSGGTFQSVEPGDRVIQTLDRLCEGLRQ